MTRGYKLMEAALLYLGLVLIALLFNYTANGGRHK